MGALSRAAGISYEMARRYAEGVAMPRPDTLERIASWLDVAPASLAWGIAGGSSSIDAEVLQQCIAAVREAQKKTGATLTPEREAKLVAMLYLEAAEGRRPAQAAIARMLRALS